MSTRRGTRKTKEHVTAFTGGVRKRGGCGWKEWGKECGKELAEDSYFYCEDHSREVRRSV
jgi:hypothetical protein